MRTRLVGEENTNKIRGWKGKWRIGTGENLICRGGEFKQNKGVEGKW